MNNPTLKLRLIKKFNLKFIPLLALTFILSSACLANPTPEELQTKDHVAALKRRIYNPAQRQEVELYLNITRNKNTLNKLNNNLWHYRRDSLNTKNLADITKIFNENHNIPSVGMVCGGSEIILKTAQILKDLYQGYLIGYANKEEKLIIVDALLNFTEKVPENAVIKDLLDKARKSTLSLDDLIKEFTKKYPAESSVKKELNSDLILDLANESKIKNLFERINKQQPDEIDFLSNLSDAIYCINFHIKILLLAPDATTKTINDFLPENIKTIYFIVEDQIQRLKKSHSFSDKLLCALGNGSIDLEELPFEKITNTIQNEENKLKQIKSVEALVNLNLHKASREHAQLTYELLYNILYV